MARYCITAAKPKNSGVHLKSQFKLWLLEKENDKLVSSLQGWKSGADIAALLDAGNQVLTAKDNGDKISLGAAVEMELRISKNEVNYKISDMPEE